MPGVTLTAEKSFVGFRGSLERPRGAKIPFCYFSGGSEKWGVVQSLCSHIPKGDLIPLRVRDILKSWEAMR